MDIALSISIPTGATGLSAGRELYGARPVAIAIPAGWQAADITFQASADGTTWYNLHESGSDTEVTVQAGAEKFITFSTAARDQLASVRYLKIRSGTSGTPVDQTGSPTLTLFLTKFNTRGN